MFHRDPVHCLRVCCGLGFALVLGVTAVASAQGPPPAAVRYTEAREHQVLQSLRLPGTVEAVTVSPVAAEVEGVVEAFLAREGVAVALDDPIMRLRSTNIELRLRSMKGLLKEAEARLERARRVLKRAQGLHEKDLLSDGDLDEAISDFAAWEGKVEQLSADTERLQVDLKRCVIRSPVSGVVTAEHTDVGAWVSVGDAVVDVLSLDQFKVRVDVPEKYFSMVRANEPATVTIDGDPPYTVEGRVTAIIPRADTRSRVFPVKVSVANRDGRLAAGMLAEANLPIGDAHTAIIVPKDALVTQGPAQFVFVMNEQGMVNRVQVQPGYGVGDWITVEGEIEVGSKVITRGNERIFPGMQVAGEPQEYPLP